MTARFATNLILVLLGAWLIAASRLWPPGTVSWMALGTGAATVLVALGGLAIAGREAQIFLHLLEAVLGGWIVVSARPFPAATSTWLALAEGVGLLFVALIGVAAGEIPLHAELRRRREEDLIAHDPVPALTRHREAPRQVVNG